MSACYEDDYPVVFASVGRLVPERGVDLLALDEALGQLLVGGTGQNWFATNLNVPTNFKLNNGDKRIAS